MTEELFEEFYKGTEGREVSTTMVFVRMLAKMLRDPEIGKLIVPIVPDEARTFGMEALFRQIGIYSSVGQLYEPVDMDTLLYYKEAKNGQILEEGITEAGSMWSFIAAGTSYANHGINTIPVLHLLLDVRLAAHRRPGLGRGRHALPRLPGRRHGGTHHPGGRGLAASGRPQPRAGSPVPNLVAYDPAFAYEMAVIIQDGIRRMYVEGEYIFYYMTVINEPLPHARDAQRAGQYARAS